MIKRKQVLDSHTIIARALDQYGGDQKSSTDHIMVCCPFHSDSKPSCGIFMGEGLQIPLGFYHCFSGETRVLTSKGTFDIKSLSGKSHWVVTQGNKWVKARFECYGKQRLYRVTLSRNSTTKTVYATEKHRWFVDYADWRTCAQKGYKGEKTTIELIPGAYLRSAIPPRQKFKLQLDGIRHGFVFGDGTVNGNHAYAYLCGEKRRYMHKYFENYLMKDRGDRLSVANLPKEWKSLPDIKSKFSYLYGFLAGYIAADGCVDERGSIMLHSSKKEDLYAIRDICNLLGLLTTDIKGYDSRDTNYKKDTSLYHLFFVKKSFPEGLLLNPEHKRRYLNSREGNARLRWKVLSVEKTERIDQVYCCDVPRTHSFVLEDYILTGNCFGCGSRGPWNKFAERAKLPTIKSWANYNTKLDYKDLDDYIPDLKSLIISIKAQYTEWPTTMTWRGYSGRLVRDVGGLMINDRKTNGIMAFFPIEVGDRLRGGIKAYVEKPAFGLSYLSTEGSWVKKYGLFPYQHVEQMMISHKNLALVEGPRDALRLIANGIPALAVLGAQNFGPDKALQVAGLQPKRVYAIPDTDEAGYAMGQNVKRYMRRYCESYIIGLGKGDKKIDPDNASQATIDKIRRIVLDT